MTPIQEITHEVLAASSRRAFLRRASLAGIAGALAPAAASLFTPTPAWASPTPSLALDVDILNFALNLEFLEAQFYTYAVTGAGIGALGISTAGGDGTAGGDVTVKPSGTTKVPFTDNDVAAYATEIATDEQNHVKFLQSALDASGGLAVAQPKLDLYNSFNALAVVAGIGTAFDPFASDLDFLLGAFIFEDVGVTAYHGAAPLVFTKAYLKAAAGILAVEAYHASEVRTVLNGMARAASDPSVILGLVQKISDARDSIDTVNSSIQKDQGIGDAAGDVNIVPADENSIAFARSTTQVLRIVYGSAAQKPVPGLFFPDGMNGAIS